MGVARKEMSKLLAEYVAGLRYEDLPGEVIQLAKIAVLDQIGCELIGSTLEWNQIPYRLVRDQDGKPESTIVNYGTKVLARDAAFVNGTFGQGAELDDYGGGRGGAHSGAICIPIGLALGEKNRIGGREFLAAAIIGYQVAWGLGEVMHIPLKARGFHAQGIIGVFVATAVAGRLLGLKPEELGHAFAIAGSHASGTMEYDQSGGEVKRVHTGIAVENGIKSAMLASYGLTGPSTIFEGKRGILRLFAGENNPGDITLDLSSKFGIIYNGIKLYPINGSQQAAINILTSLMEEHRFKAEEVEHVDVGLNESSVAHCGSVYEPREVIQAQFSLPFSIAIRLLKESNDLPLYMDRRLWHDPQVLALAHKVHVYPAFEAAGEVQLGCKMRVTLTGGRILEAHLDHAKGSWKNPLTKEEVQSKFRRLASSVLSAERIEEIINTVDNIDQVRDVSQLVSLLVR